MALGVVNPDIPYKRLKIIGILNFSIPPGHQNKLARQSTKSVMIGYEKNSKAYRRWDPASDQIIALNDVVFNEDAFLLRDLDKASTGEPTILNDESWDKVWESPISQHQAEDPQSEPGNQF